MRPEPPPSLTFSVRAMAATRETTPWLWRWALIVSSLLVIAENIAVRVTPYMRRYTGLSAFAAILSGAALAFLFLGGPFLVRSQRWLAVAGWAIAALSILFSAL